MGSPNKALRDWLKAATALQAGQLAKAAQTSVPHLRHIAAGRRKASADLAQRLAHASLGFPNLAMRLDQRALCDACGRCPYAIVRGTEPARKPVTKCGDGQCSKYRNMNGGCDACGSPCL